MDFLTIFFSYFGKCNHGTSLIHLVKHIRARVYIYGARALYEAARRERKLNVSIFFGIRNICEIECASVCARSFTLGRARETRNGVDWFLIIVYGKNSKDPSL